MFKKTPSLSNKASPDNVYINVRINHDSTNNTVTLAKYSVTKSIPILQRPDEYYVCVTDFCIPLGIIPITIAKIEKNQPNPNLMTQIFYFEILDPGAAPVVNRGPIAQPAIFITPSTNFQPPIQNDRNQQIITPYYYIYSYSYLLNLYNIAINTAWNTLKADNPGCTLSNGRTLNEITPPYFYLDPATQLINLIVDSNMTRADNPADPGNPGWRNPLIGFYMNDAAANYLQGFNVEYISNIPPSLVFDRYQFVFYNDQNICNAAGGDRRVGVGGYYYYEQEYQSLELWSDLRKIFVASTSMPIKGEEKAVNLPNGTQTGQTSYVQVLFDYTPQFTNSASGRTINYYVPQSQYRLVDYLGTEPLTKISLDVYWQDTIGDIYPLYIQKYQAVNLKLGFFKKSLYKHYFPDEQEDPNKPSYKY